jgi:hypothetical protein
VVFLLLKQLKTNKMRVTVSGNLGADVASVGANGTIAANAVTVQGDFGIITTGALTTAADVWVTPATVTNAAVKSTSTIVLSINSMTGTAGTNGAPVAVVSAKVDGSFTLSYGNVGTNALSGAFSISYRVLNA